MGLGTDSAYWKEAYGRKGKKAIFRKLEKEPFAEKFGIKLLELDEGYSKVEMKFTPDMENFLGMAHGGALFALIDEAFETASNSHGTVAVALNMNITDISPPSPKSRLIDEAREFSRTQRTAVYDIKLSDEQKNLIATCGALVYGAPRASPWSLKDAHVGRHPDHKMAHSSTAKAVVFCLSG